jgi:hypothetical protein
MPRFDLVTHTRSAVEFSRVSYLRLSHSRFRSASLVLALSMPQTSASQALRRAAPLAWPLAIIVLYKAFIQAFQPEQPLCSIRSFDSIK